MSRRYSPQTGSAPRYARDSDATNIERYRYRIERKIADNEAAARRWRQLRARLRVARALRYSSQNRLLPSTHPVTRNSESCGRSSLVNRLASTKDRQTVGPEAKSTSQLDMTTAGTSRRSRYLRTTWWKSNDDEDRSNRNDPAAPVLDNEGAVSRQQLSVRRGRTSGHVIDNFRCTDADRNESRTRYVEQNMNRYVRSYRRVRSLDEDSDNEDHLGCDGRPVRSFYSSRTIATAVKFLSNTSESLEDLARTSDVGRISCDDVEQTTRSTLKRSISRCASDPLFAGRSVAQRRAIDDLLSLDRDDETQPMDVDDTDVEEDLAGCHNCDNEFQEITTGLRRLCLHCDDTKVGAAGDLVAGPTSAGSRPRSVINCSTAEERRNGHHQTASSEVTIQTSTEDTGCPHSYVLSGTDDKTINRSVGNDPNCRYRYSVSSSVSTPESTFSRNVDQPHRSELDESNFSKVLFGFSVNNLSPPSRPGLVMHVSANSCLSKYDDTSVVVSSVHYKM